MKALVVYESMFGNTREIATAVADGLHLSADVELVEVGHAPATPGDEIDLIVVGGPTHAFSMSRANTRADAVRQGADPTNPTSGIRDWLSGLPTGTHHERLATFDTRVAKMRHLPGSAAKSAAKVARRHGYQEAAPAESFYVQDSDGPLLDGELDRAEAWGRELAVTRLTQAPD
jgi:hypothetical protein